MIINYIRNYPNPFNPSTSIKFAIPEAGQTSLKVYDATGRKWLSSFPTTTPPGTMLLILTLQACLPSVYIYKLEAGNKIFTKIDVDKIVLQGINNTI
ncbi:MAG: T9SS type A sorting domain-containing protein [Ignavibacteriales bacterium]|nr:T9SS type A sorting domain-containing protein [Ignavibacteriales bacterium]